MKTLIEFLATLLQFFTSWFWATSITFGFRFLIVIFSGIFGWLVGCFFGETFLSIFALLGLKGFSMWQIGAFLGFIGSFFSPMINYKNDKKPSKN